MWDAQARLRLRKKRSKGYKNYFLFGEIGCSEAWKCLFLRDVIIPPQTDSLARRDLFYLDRLGPI